MRRWLLPAAYLLLAWIAAVQQWSLQRPGDPYTHYNNYIIFRQAFVHLVHGQDLYVQYLAEHWDYFRYSPSFAAAFGAFAWMPDLPGLLLWNTLNALVLLLALWTLPALPAPARDDRIRLAVGWFVAIEMMTALQNAQSNVLIAGLLILAFNCLERRQNAIAALAIVVAAYIKPFALVGFSLFLFYPDKGTLALWSSLWIAMVGALPLLAVSPSQLIGLYGSWRRLLTSDFAQGTGLSIMGWLAAWFNMHPPKVLVDLAGIALFCWPLLYVARWRDVALPPARAVQCPRLGRALQPQGGILVVHHRDVRRGVVVLCPGENPAQHHPRGAGVCLHEPVADRRVSALLERELLRALYDQGHSVHPDLAEDHLRPRVGRRPAAPGSPDSRRRVARFLVQSRQVRKELRS